MAFRPTSLGLSVGLVFFWGQSKSSQRAAGNGKRYASNEHGVQVRASFMLITPYSLIIHQPGRWRGSDNTFLIALAASFLLSSIFLCLRRLSCCAGGRFFHQQKSTSLTDEIPSFLLIGEWATNVMNGAPLLFPSY